MNLLGHALLSFKVPELLCGNMMGDFVKGKKALETFPDGIQQGLLLHRKIDYFTDHHPAVKRAQNLFREAYGLYSGAIIDIVFDHYLANDPKYFNSKEDLADFNRETIDDLRLFTEFQPQAFRELIDILDTKQLLLQYRNLKGYRKALVFLCKRMRLEVDHEPAWMAAMQFYQELNQYYFDFIEDVVSFVKNELKV